MTNSLERIAAALERIADTLDNPRPMPNLSAAEVARIVGWKTPDALLRGDRRKDIEALPPEGWGFPPPITDHPLRWDPAAIEAWRASKMPSHLCDTIIDVKGANIDFGRLLDARGDVLAGRGKGRAA